MVLRPHPVRELSECDLSLPSTVLPVLAGFAELRRFWALPAIRLHNPYRRYPCVYKEEDDIPGRHLPHRFVERIPGSVGFALGAPQVSTGQFGAERRIVLEDPELSILSPADNNSPMREPM